MIVTPQSTQCGGVVVTLLVTHCYAILLAANKNHTTVTSQLNDTSDPQTIERVGAASPHCSADQFLCNI